MTYKITRSSRINYDKILDGNMDCYTKIAMVIYISNYDKRPHITMLSDRESKDAHGEFWYKGAFGNCLIALLAGHTDKLYLFTPKMVGHMGAWMTDEEVLATLDKNARHIIERKTT